MRETKGCELERAGLMLASLGRRAGLDSVSIARCPTGAATMSERSTYRRDQGYIHQADDKIESAEKGAPPLAPILW